jgi:hypothetical protein
MDERAKQKLRELYALYLTKYPFDEEKAALMAIHKHPGMALFTPEQVTQTAKMIRDYFKDDVLVKLEMVKVREQGHPELEIKPEDVKQTLWEMGNNWRIDAKDRISAMKLYAECNGMIEKTPKVSIENNANKVMVVKDYGDDWETKAAKQQEKLTRG